MLALIHLSIHIAVVTGVVKVQKTAIIVGQIAEPHHTVAIQIVTLAKTSAPVRVIAVSHPNPRRVIALMALTMTATDLPIAMIRTVVANLTVLAGQKVWDVC